MNILKTLLTGAFAVSVSIAQGSSNSATVKDADGNVYKTVKIGTQVWMAENLRATKYNDGTSIPLDTSTETWNNAMTPKYCYYDNTTNIDRIKKYGALYNWYVVSPENPRNIAPKGWHVPSDAEWNTLQKYLVAKGYNWDRTIKGNKIAKSLAAKTDWNTDGTKGAIGCDMTKNNTSGFSAFPGGCRTNEGGFNHQSECVYWWSTTTQVTKGDADDDSEFDVPSAYERNLSYGSVNIYRDPDNKSSGSSVRLLKD